MELFKERLQILLDEQNLNQKELAKMSGVTEVTISRYMNGFRNPRIEIANKIAQVLGTSTDYLLGNSDIKNPHTTNIKSDDIDPLDIYLDELKKEAVKRNINFDTTSPSDLLDFLEFIQKTKEKKQ